MFDDVLIESAGKDKRTGGWVTALISGVIHLGLVGAIVAAGYYVKENPEVIEKPISAFIVTSAPPPPPPPPPPASSAGSTTPKPRVETPVEQQPRETFRQPTEVPQDVPQVSDVASSEEEADAGVPGGVVGGVKGGVVGGVVGGVKGGVAGGVVDGMVGGQGGGTGDTPVRVGGNVKAPVIVTRVDPVYTEIARRARIQGIVIIEAVIDRNGNVTEARILKALPMGLDQSALNAVKQWKFRPGTLNGNPVPVYYNLTVNFQVQ
jgi:periplasmic protein TonB